MRSSSPMPDEVAPRSFVIGSFQPAAKQVGFSHRVDTGRWEMRDLRLGDLTHASSVALPAGKNPQIDRTCRNGDANQYWLSPNAIFQV